MQSLFSSTILQTIPKTIFSISLATGLIISTFCQANANNYNDTLAIDTSESYIRKYEVAVLHVLSEICPPMLTKAQQREFSKAYDKELKSLLPNLNNPKQALQYLSTQQDYQKILADERKLAFERYSKEENKKTCEELLSN